VREWRVRLCAPRGVLGIDPCRAGRLADTVMVSNGHYKHEKLCVGRNTSRKVRCWSPSHSLLTIIFCCMTTKLAPVDHG